MGYVVVDAFRSLFVQLTLNKTIAVSCVVVFDIYMCVFMWWHSSSKEVMSHQRNAQGNAAVCVCVCVYKYKHLKMCVCVHVHVWRSMCASVCVCVCVSLWIVSFRYLTFLTGSQFPICSLFWQWLVQSELICLHQNQSDLRSEQLIDHVTSGFASCHRLVRLYSPPVCTLASAFRMTLTMCVHACVRLLVPSCSENLSREERKELVCGNCNLCYSSLSL